MSRFNNEIDNKETIALLLHDQKETFGSTYWGAIFDTVDNTDFERYIPGGQGKGVYYL